MRRLMKLDEQWKPMRQNVPPLKTEQSKKEGVPNHGLAQLWASFHLHHPWHSQCKNYGLLLSINFVHCIILSIHQ